MERPLIGNTKTDKISGEKMLMSVNDEDTDMFEECFCCGKVLTQGIGRFRKSEGVICIKCYKDYKDKALSCKESEAREGSERISFVRMNLSRNRIVD